MNTSLGLLQSVGIGFAAIVLVAVVAVILFILTSAVKIVKEYERGVIFRLGRVQGRAKGPGLFILIPVVDRMVKVELRTVTLDVPPLDLFKPYLNSSSPDGYGASAVQKKSHEMETMSGDEKTEGDAPNVIPNGETNP